MVRREAGAVSAVAGAVVFEVVCRALFPISSYFPSYGEHTLERGRRSERGLITDADMNNRPGRIRTARLRPTRPNPRDRDIPARVRGGDGMRVDEPEGAAVQRADVPREQDGRGQDRRGAGPHQPGLLHHQAHRRHPGRLLQARRQVLHRFRETASHGTLPP